MAMWSKQKQGAKLIETTHVALHHSLKGLEFASGIPGSVGGAVFMNAGASWGEIAHVLVSCKVLTKEGEIETLSAKELALATVILRFKRQGAVVISAKFALSPGNHEQIKQEMERLTHLRQLK